MNTCVVLHAPLGSNLRLGTRVSDADIPKLQSQPGYVLLPVEPHPSPLALRDYAHRSFGEQEVVLLLDTPRRIANLALAHDPSLPHLHWLACVAAAGRNPRCSLSLTPDDGGGQLARGSLDSNRRAVLDPGELELPGDWDVIGGRAHLTIGTGPSIAGFTFQALGNDVAILWVALSQCSEHRAMPCLERGS